MQLDREIIGIEEFVLVQDREFEAERGAQYRLLRWRDRANERIQYVEAQVKGLDRVTEGGVWLFPVQTASVASAVLIGKGGFTSSQPFPRNVHEALK